MLQVGSILDNKYKILNEVGHGGMSVVYLAINERANKTWAVKEIRKSGVVDFEAVKQGLVVETDMLKKFNHPNLPSIIDVLDYEDSFIIVMDYIEGSSLHKLLKTEGAQPEEKVIKWARQLCDVLGYLHRQNPPIIYRDMKPANVMLRPDGNITLIDFGIAREFKNRNMVEDTTCLGTRGYAAPEQFGGRGQTDPRTDIYCLGATMYHLLTGHSPAEPPYEIKPLSYWIPQYAGSGLEKLILKCTKQDPSARYQSCEELMYALKHYKDEDEALLKHRRKLWRRFVAGLVVGCIGLGGAIGFNIARNGAKQATYDAYIETALHSSSLKEAESNLNKALELDAGAAEAYEAMITLADNDMLANGGSLSSDTANVLNKILTGTASGNRTNQDILDGRNKEEYTKLMYDMGLWYFFMKDNTPQDRKLASENYFSKIQDDTHKVYLTSGQQELSKILFDIGGYISSLNSKMSMLKGDTEDGGNYKALFNDYAKIVNGDLKSKVEYDIYCIKIYEQIAADINKDFKAYKSNSVTPQDMKGMLENILKGLNDLDVSKDNIIYEDWQSALTTVNNAIAEIGRANS